MDLLLRAYAYTTVMTGLLRERLREERGQTALEYVGILIVVGLMIFAFTELQVASRARAALTTAVNQILGSGGGGAPAPGDP